MLIIYFFWLDVRVASSAGKQKQTMILNLKRDKFTYYSI